MEKSINYKELGSRTARKWAVLAGLCLTAGLLWAPAVEAQTILHSIGDPSPEEQLTLELINRARANPTAEGTRLTALVSEEVSVFSDTFFFSTNLSVMRSELAALPVAPPLTFNSILIYTSRNHSQYMLANNTQTHLQTGASTYYWDRMENAGYVWSEAAENIFASAINPEEAHASFEIDWGSGTHGMQNGRGHRERIHSWSYREIGIGWVAGSGSNVGPFAVTHNFGERLSRSQIKPYLTGVAIYDADGDGFYDIGEGISGVTVTVDLDTGGTLTRHDTYAVTASSGGYSIPVDVAGDYLVNFEVPGMPVQSVPVTVVSETIPGTSNATLTNQKVDLVLQEGANPGYTPPSISSETQIAEGSTTLVDFPDVPGSIDYEVLVSGFDANPVEQDADVSAPVTTDMSSSYALVSVPLNQGDRLAFHLAHPSVSSNHQSMTLERVFVPGPAASITFDSRLRRSGSGQIATLQVTADGGASFTDVWFQQGTNSFADEMLPVTVDVSEFEGQAIKFRWLFYIGGGGINSGTGWARGWHFDDISFSGMRELTAPSSATVTASEYAYTPAATGDFHLQVRARTGQQPLPYAAYSTVQVSSNDFAGWAQRKESASGLIAGTLADSTADYDGDGLTQLAEYALEASGLDPTTSDPAMVPAAEIEGSNLCVHYKRDTALGDVSVAVEVSTDLENWFLPGDPGAPAGFTDYVTATLGTIEDRTAEIPFGTREKLFMRLKVTELAP